MKLMQFGELIPGLEKNGRPIDVPVFNERAVRASAGLMLAAAVFAFVNALFDGNFFYVKIVVALFTFEFLVRIFVNPHLAPFFALGKVVVSPQEPEYTGAPQKRFAWSMGAAMAIVMSIAIFGFGITGHIFTRLICSICIALLWLESAFGICVGCKIYRGLYLVGILKEPPQACPGYVCEIPSQTRR